MNKITRTPPIINEEEDLANQMSVGGQEIGPPAPGTNTQPFMKAHNLRYSSAINDFSGPGTCGSPKVDEKASINNHHNVG